MTSSNTDLETSAGERQFRQRTPFSFWPAIAVLAVAYAAVLVVGLKTDEPLIGDEVTHYYMLVKQAETLPAPNVTADIPLANGKIERRHYPHVFLWHYLGAIAYNDFGSSFRTVQIYHSLFWLQFLVVVWLLARTNRRADPLSGLVYVTLAATIPMCLLLSVAFYQDIPATAQVLTAFLFLRKRKVAWSAFFMGLAIAIKITIFILLPAYFLCVLLYRRDAENKWVPWVKMGIAILIIGIMCAVMANGLNSVGWEYYPATVFKQYAVRLHLEKPVVHTPNAVTTRLCPPVNPSAPRPEVANNPGDLRLPVNFLIYGGCVLYVVLLAAIPGFVIFRRQRKTGHHGDTLDMWAFWAGLWYLAATSYHMLEAPDARFFLPGIVLVLLPLSQAITALPLRRFWLPALLALSLLQGGIVLKKIHDLRNVSAPLREAIHYLKTNRPSPNAVFMYPEGNYRLFPCEHNWYLDFQLKDFWKANNDRRLEMLHQYGLGAIVIKKRLVGKLDPEMNNLGIYPDFFVRDIENDKRFRRVFDNEDVAIYLVPQSTREPEPAGNPDSRG